jgi:hypothetical protein
MILVAAVLDSWHNKDMNDDAIARFLDRAAQTSEEEIDDAFERAGGDVPAYARNRRWQDRRRDAEAGDVVADMIAGEW